MSVIELIEALGPKTKLQKHAIECSLCRTGEALHWYCSNCSHGFCESWDEHRSKLDDEARVVFEQMEWITKLFANPKAVKQLTENRLAGQTYFDN